MKKTKIYIIISLIAVCGFLPAIQPVQAFVASGVPNSIDWDLFFTHLEQSLEYEALSQASNIFINATINKALSLRGIKQYDTYLKNVTNQVYVTSLIQNSNVRDAYITRSLINDISGIPGTHANLSPQYTQAAVQNCNINNINKKPPGPDTFLFLASCPAQLSATAPMQQALAQDRALTTYSQAQQYATLDISQGNGSKTGYNCTTLAQVNNPNPPPDSTSVTEAKINCAVQNPARYATTYVDSQIQDALGYENKPQDSEDAAARAIAKTLSTALLNKFVVPGVAKLFGESPQALVTGPPPITAPPPGTTGVPLFSLTHFKASSTGSTPGSAGFGSPGNTSFLAAGPGDSISFSWDASSLKTKGADSVVFSNGNHASDIYAPLNNGTQITVNGTSTNTFSLTVLTANGQSMASDSITVGTSGLGTTGGD